MTTTERNEPGCRYDDKPMCPRGTPDCDCPRIAAAVECREPLPIHRTEAGWPRCSTCDGNGCPDFTDPA